MLIFQAFQIDQRLLVIWIVSGLIIYISHYWKHQRGGSHPIDLKSLSEHFR
ncbi:MAG: hypothetical protein BECKG1743F_GA0114225_1000226 [Candidatus Kentron sp. G]|nr:MAG: hypothetical protein BECKG1743F_GA0114225_1000226 [Candidatus Kentron sp. G]